ncbi:MAG: MFS transporter [Bryobacteraceae bacterium]|jgi:hypothetical protein
MSQHLRQHDRVTRADRVIQARANSFHIGEDVPQVTHWLAAEPSDEEANG